MLKNSVDAIKAIGAQVVVCGGKISKLLAAHAALEGKLQGETIGINVDNGELIDAADAQIYDHILVKDWQVRLAVSTAVTILRVNQIIMAKAAGGPKAPSQRGGHWDDDHDDIE